MINFSMQAISLATTKTKYKNHSHNIHQYALCNTNYRKSKSR